MASLDPSQFTGFLTAERPIRFDAGSWSFASFFNAETL